MVSTRAALRFIDPWDLVTEIGDGVHGATVLSDSQESVVARLDVPLAVGGRLFQVLQLTARHEGADLTARCTAFVLANFRLLEGDRPAVGDRVGVAEFRRL